MEKSGEGVFSVCIILLHTSSSITARNYLERLSSKVVKRPPNLMGYPSICSKIRPRSRPYWYQNRTSSQHELTSTLVEHETQKFGNWVREIDVKTLHKQSRIAAVAYDMVTWKRMTDNWKTTRVQLLTSKFQQCSKKPPLLRPTWEERGYPLL